MSALPGRRRSALGVMASLLIAGTLLGPAASGGRARAGGDRRIQVADQSEDRVYAADGPTIQLARAGYRLEANPLSTLVTVESPRGALYTRFPLLMLNGTATLPPGSHRSLALTGGSLVATLEDAQGRVLERTILTPWQVSFSVRFTSVVAPAANLWPTFFCDGRMGLEVDNPADAFFPSGAGHRAQGAPAISVIGRRPFAPPPFDVQIRGAAGWIGLGLVQVPDATTMRLAPGGGIAIDYPLETLANIPDSGAGGLVGTMVSFPTFVATFGTDPFTGLGAYEAALVASGAAPAANPDARPSWWQQPIVDTWGEQIAQGAGRGSPRFTAAWVRRFASDWRRRFGVGRFTLVIDSRWQQGVGSPRPDPARFGDWQGMRRLIDDLHRQNIRVLLWWPLWVRYPYQVPPGRQALNRLSPAYFVDPTAPSFESETAAAMSRLLGTGPGELGADGLKLDWGYDLLTKVRNPRLGWGAAALLRYLAILHADAHRLRPDALIESSAVAPQFMPATDTIRLYDGWSEAQWAARAAIVSRVDPGVLIDGDGWRAGPLDIARHTIASTVYGVPAIYFADHWATGTALPAPLAATLGHVVALSQLKGAGAASMLPNGDWRYTRGGRMTAESFDANQALAVWAYSGCLARAKVVSSVEGAVRVPLPVEGVRSLDAEPGVVYSISAAVPDCQRGKSPATG